MADSRISVGQEHLSCSVCLDLLIDPVTLNCGHSYCQKCIKEFWDEVDRAGAGVYTCPQCRKQFSLRPTLSRNTILTELVEELKNTKLRASCPACVGPRDVKQLAVMKKKCQQKIQMLQELQQLVNKLTSIAETEVEDSENMLTDIICSMNELKEQIRAQEKDSVSQSEELLKQLKQELAELIRRDAELKKLLHSEGHIHFPLNIPSLFAPPGPGELSNLLVHVHRCFTDMRNAISQLKEKMDAVLKKEVNTILLTGGPFHFTGPLTRTELLHSACRLTLDFNTVHKNLRISTLNTMVTQQRTPLSHPDHPERFDCCRQVLCSEGLSRPSYWEVEWRGQDVDIAVTYKGLSRKGEGLDCWLGQNFKSWCLCCTQSGYTLMHNNEKSKVPAPVSHRIGVYLNPKAGTLTFYIISETISAIHKVQTIFTEPLYPGFRVGLNSSVKLYCLDSELPAKP